MKQYLLLRDNRQSGPWTLAQMEAMTLRPNDLVWVEGGNPSWNHPGDIPELAAWVREESYEERESRRLALCTRSPQEHDAGFLEPVFLSPELFPERLRKPASRRIPVWKRHLMKPSSGALNMLAVFVGLIFFALMMKKMVDGFSEGPSHDLPVAYASAGAYEARQDGLQHALSREVIPSDEDLEKMPPPLSTRPKDIKQQIRMKVVPNTTPDSLASQRVQIRFYNGSPHFVEKLTIRVEFLRRDSVTGSTLMTVSALPSFGEKQAWVTIPEAGIRVKPHVRSVYSSEYRQALKNL